MVGGFLRGWGGGIGSQWSLTFEVRKSATGSFSGFARQTSQWSLTFEVRKRLAISLVSDY